jgi:hypothetical protein
MAFFSAQKIKKISKNIGYILVCIFAVIGFGFTSVFVGMKYGLLNVKGSIAGRNQFFLGNNKNVKPATFSTPCLDTKESVCEWNQTPEWTTVSGGLVKDADIINRVSKETGVQARMIASVVTPEQTRFFTSNREVWKSYFEPLKVLISLSQFSLGVSGVKIETAKMIEQYAKDKNSEFYPGDNIDTLIAYKDGADHDTELYNRLTDEKNHYYQYLYTALYIREIEAQWQKAGFDISHNPESVVTLFNIGFAKSIPNRDPLPGGAPINLGGKVYSYGELGANLYYSNELIDIFPKVQLSYR